MNSTHLSTPRHALIAGGGGVIGRALVEHLAASPSWRVTALSRRPLSYDTPAQWRHADLLDPASCREAFAGLASVTDVFYAAYQDGAGWADLVEPNRAMLQNLVETIEPVAPGLRRVVLFTGGKVYGSVLGPYRTPAKESDPRHLPPNFYYDQEDFLARQQQGKAWSWTVLRPAHICGSGTGNPMNIGMAIAVYATLCREFGIPMRFPGKASVYQRLTQFAEAPHLARGAAWAVHTASAANQVFNCTNGDFARWQDLWPMFADYFGLRYAPPLPISLETHMADKGPLWSQIAQREGLREVPWQDLVGWRYADRVFNLFEWDFMSSTTRIRQHGFHDVVDSEAMFIRIFDRYRSERLIP